MSGVFVANILEKCTIVCLQLLNVHPPAEHSMSNSSATAVILKFSGWLYGTCQIVNFICSDSIVFKIIHEISTPGDDSLYDWQHCIAQNDNYAVQLIILHQKFIINF